MDGGGISTSTLVYGLMLAAIPAAAGIIAAVKSWRTDENMNKRATFELVNTNLVEQVDRLEARQVKYEKTIDEQAEMIRDLKDQLAEAHRTIETFKSKWEISESRLKERDARIKTLTGKLIKLEGKNGKK